MSDKSIQTNRLRVHARANEVVRRLIGEEDGPLGRRGPGGPPPGLPDPDELELPPGGPDAAEERTEIDIGHDLLAIADGGDGPGAGSLDTPDPEPGGGPDAMARVRELAKELLALHGETDDEGPGADPLDLPPTEDGPPGDRMPPRG